MNKKENDQLKKIEQLDKQLDNTINKIGVTKVEPIKISKKKLALFMLIPFSLACVLTAVTSFLVIDPFHWYTKSRLSLEQKQEKEIKRIKQEFADLSLATALDSSSTIADLLWEVELNSNINQIVQSPNEIKSITSKKDNNSKLSSTGEEVNIKILVRTGSLEKQIDVTLKVIVDNQTVKQVNRLVKYQQFLDSITSTIIADGKKRVSNLVDVIKTIIDENDIYKAVFKDVKFDIVNDKNDDEIIASGSKTLNVNFSFKENNKLITSSVKLNVNLQGKSRKVINAWLTSNLQRYKLNFSDDGTDGLYDFTAQTTFANISTYKDLIDELILSASNNNFYFSTDIFNEIDNNDSKISVDFTIANQTSEKLNEPISITDGKGWKVVTLKLHFFVGSGQDKHKVRERPSFDVLVMNKNYPHKELFLYMGKLRELISKDIFKYEVKANKIGKRYGELRKELEKEIDRLIEKIDKPEKMYGFRFQLWKYRSLQADSEVITVDNLVYPRYYETRIYLEFNNQEIPDSPKLRPFWLYVSID